MPTRKPKDLFVTHEALDHVRKELKSDIASVILRVSSLEKKMDARFDEVDSKFNQMDAKFNQMDAKFGHMDSKLDQMNSKLEEMNATTQRTLALMEDQNIRNRASYEGAEAVREQNEDLTRRVSALEEFQHDITKRLK